MTKAFGSEVKDPEFKVILSALVRMSCLAPTGPTSLMLRRSVRKDGQVPE